MEHQQQSDNQPQHLGDDILRGADEIAHFIFGARGNRRMVYYLAECSRLPVFRLGSVLCARWSVLLDWIAGQEGRVAGQAERVRTARGPDPREGQRP